MVKKPIIKMFEKNDFETPEAKARRRRPVGVYLRLDVRSEIEKIAAKENLNVHALLAYAVSNFVREYRKGKIKLETTKKTTLNLDV